MRLARRIPQLALAVCLATMLVVSTGGAGIAPRATAVVTVTTGGALPEEGIEGRSFDTP